jgi:GrpB-like predicted nucleotidyltransferase (UPF0157 family)
VEHWHVKVRMHTPEHESPADSCKEGDATTQPEIVSSRISVVDYDERWPDMFRRKAEAIRAVMGPRALQVSHIGSTSVPGLAAKPVIDILLVVADSADEDSYVPALESAGYVLRIREPDWYEHRMFKGNGPESNLHVFSLRCEEIARVLTFRNWLRNNPADRDLYARAKLDLAQREWKYVQEYADAKTSVIREMMARAGTDA